MIASFSILMHVHSAFEITYRPIVSGGALNHPLLTPHTCRLIA